MWNRNQNLYFDNRNHRQAQNNLRFQHRPMRNEQYLPVFSTGQSESPPRWGNFHNDSRPVRFIHQGQTSQHPQTFPIQDKKFPSSSNVINSFDVKHGSSPNQDFPLDFFAATASQQKSFVIPFIGDSGEVRKPWNSNSSVPLKGRFNTKAHGENISLEPVFPPDLCTANASHLKSYVIPFTGDSCEVRKPWNSNSSVPLRDRFNTKAHSENISLEPSATISTAWPMKKENGGLYDDDEENERYDLRSDPYPNTSQNKSSELVESDSFSGNPREDSNVVSSLSNSSQDTDRDRKPFTSDSSTPASIQGDVHLKISEVLGDTKMLNDILSVAKSLQFSTEQSKTSTFPSNSSNYKNIAIVPPISHQNETPCTEAVSTTSTFANDRNYADYTSDTMRRQDAWSKNNQTNKIPGLSDGQGNVQSSYSRKRHFVEEETDGVSLYDSCASPAKYKSTRLSTNVHEKTEHSSAAAYSSDLTQALTLNEKSNVDSCIVTADETSKNSIDDGKDLKTNALEVKSPEALAEVDLSTPSANVEDVKESENSSCLSPRTSTPTEEMTQERASALIFENLADCKLTTDSDAAVVLQMISTLTEMYLKHKFRFMPISKFKSLMKSLKSGKEKETSFILNFLKCGGTSADEESSAQTKKETGILNNATTVETSNNSNIVTVAAATSVTANATMAQSMHFVSMYAPGAMAMPPNYWNPGGMTFMSGAPPDYMYHPQPGGTVPGTAPSAIAQMPGFSFPPMPPQFAPVQPPPPPPPVDKMVHPPLPPPPPLPTNTCSPSSSQR